jgi:hypothetical protein
VYIILMSFFKAKQEISKDLAESNGPFFLILRNFSLKNQPARGFGEDSRPHPSRSKLIPGLSAAFSVLNKKKL